VAPRPFPQISPVIQQKPGGGANVRAMLDTLLESQLFGHVGSRGVYRGPTEQRRDCF